MDDFGEVHGFDDAFGATGFCWPDDLRIEKARGHAGGGVDEPCAEMGDGVFGVAVVFGEDEGGSESGNIEAEVKECVAVGGEGVGVRLARSQDVWIGGVGRVGPVVFRFGEEVVRRSGAAWRGEVSKGNGRLLQIVVCGVKDTVVVDGGYVGTCCGF